MTRRRDTLATMRVILCPAVAGAILALASAVAAQPRQAPPKKSSAAFSLRRDPAWAVAAEVARTRMKRGDCKGALDYFDEALRTTTEPALHRDRGLCHQAAGNPIPAAEDFRAYLTDEPDAPDAEDIRARLAGLEEERVKAATTEAAPPSGDPAVDARASTAGSGAVSLSASTREGSADRAQVAADAREGYPRGGSLDQVQTWERTNAEAWDSPLRRGKGFVVGPYFGVRRYLENGLGWGQVYGVAFRYSFSRVSTLLSEIGYSAVDGAGSASKAGGFAGLLGYEARLALDTFTTNAIYLGAGVGYEHFRQGSTGAVFATFFPRARIGYRHVFGPALGLELGADGGYAFMSLLGSAGGANVSSQSPMVGATVAVVAGF